MKKQILKKRLVFLATVSALILGSAPAALAGSLDDAQFRAMVQVVLGKAPDMDFNVEVAQTDSAKVLRVGMRPSGFRNLNGAYTGKIGGLSFLPACATAQIGAGFDAVEMDIAGIAEFRLAMADFRKMMTQKLPQEEMFKMISVSFK